MSTMPKCSILTTAEQSEQSLVYPFTEEEYRKGIATLQNNKAAGIDDVLVGGGESDVPACGPPTSFPVHLASSAVTPAGSVHKSRGDNVVRMWVQLKR